MKTPLLLLSIVLLIISSACRDSGEAQVPTELVGTWKCVGFGNTQTNQIRAIEPSNCKDCYTLILKNDRTIVGETSTNKAQGVYSASKNTNNFDVISFGPVTFIAEIGDGTVYTEKINKVNNYLLTNKNELILYYNNKEYLMFKPQ